MSDIYQPCPEVGDRDACSRCGEWLDDCECEPDDTES